MIQVLLVIHVFVALAIIGLVLLQHGKGADVGATFGSGASGTLFGSQGSANFLSRTTAYFAVAFFVINIALAYLGNKEAYHRRALDIPVPTDIAPVSGTPAPTAPVAPTVPAPASDTSIPVSDN